MDNQHNWLVLLTRVMSDPLPMADTAYLVSQTRDNALSVLIRGTELFKNGYVNRLACQKGGDGFGYCGFDYSREILTGLQISSKAIVPIEYDNNIGHINTLTELISTVRFAKQNGWKKICLVSSPFHQLRSFITAVTVADREYPSLKIYSCVGSPSPWNQHVVHSQGVLKELRSDLIITEIERIESYQENGKPYPLVSMERALDYLAKRDNG